MNIIYVKWNCFGGMDLFQALRKLGNQVYEIELTDNAKSGMDYEFSMKLTKAVSKYAVELVVSFNYYPSVSESCMKAGCPYFAWIYDSPYVKVYDASIVNNVNYIGTFDSYTADELNRMGVSTVHYVPLAVNVERIDKRISEWTYEGSSGQFISGVEYSQCDGEVAFVGSLYNDKNNFYERLFSASGDMELMGYLDAVIDTQRKIYGANILDECMNSDITAKIGSAMPYSIAKGSYINIKRIYADYYIAPRVTFLDRRDIITAMADKYKVDYYTYTDYKLGNAVNRGRLDYYADMPLVFNRTKINLNISLRSIRTGIPLRAMDIMGAGGFLLTNYQEDMFSHFVPEKHFVYYTSIEEAVDKAGYYIKHDEERCRIAESALDEIKKNHTYEVRLKEVLSQI